MSSVNFNIESGASEQQVERLKSPLKRLVIGLLLMVVVAGALGALQLYHTRMQLLQQAEANSRALADILQQAIGAVMHKTDTTLLHVVDEVVHQSGSGGLRPDELRRFVERQFHLMPELDSLRIYDSNGTAISGSGHRATMPLSLSERDVFTSLRGHGEAGMVISKPFEGTITCARRINLEGGVFGGVVYAVLPLQQFNAIFKGVPVGARGAISLCSDDLTVIARYAAGNTNDFPTDPASAAEAWQTLLRQGKSERGSYTAPSMADGVIRIYSYTRIPSYPLYVLSLIHI